VGVIAFVPVINEGADPGITNITINQFRRLVSIGKIPASMLSGSNSTTGDIYHVQRNDGSGTRVIQLAEIGHGQANLTKGYVFGNFTLASAPVLFPASGNLSVYGVSSGSDRAAFSNDYATTSVAGNGGYKSGGSIADLMKQVSSGFTGNIVSWLGTPDALSAVTGGGRVLAYNGEKLDGIAAGAITEADKDKIRTGKYSAWSFEQLFYVGTLASG
jgi:ABC-type phosphate transport system substrate-binding protein